MSLLERLGALGEPANTTTPVHAPLKVIKHPKGWEPGICWDGLRGTATSQPMPLTEGEPDHAELLKGWGFDPEKFHIAGPLQYRQWDAQVRQDDGTMRVIPFRYYKADIARGPQVAQVDIDALVSWMDGRTPQTSVVPAIGDDAFVVCLSDFQLGKGEGGGTPETIKRILSAGDAVTQRIKELRAIGRTLGTLYILGLGDIVEGCGGWYSMQEFQTDLNRRDQEKLATRILLMLLKEWARMFDRVVVAAVAGNHGENRDRQSGKAYTDFADNADLSVFENVALVLNELPEKYGHVSFVIPNDKLTLALDVAGVTVGLAHGHQFTRGGTLPQAKAFEWWKGQFVGMQPVADATILVSAHFHHFSCIQHGPRTHFQTPAMDGGSAWYRELTGADAPTGILTFRVDRTGWSDLEVVRGRAAAA